MEGPVNEFRIGLGEGWVRVSDAVGASVLERRGWQVTHAGGAYWARDPSQPSVFQPVPASEPLPPLTCGSTQPKARRNRPA